MIIVGPVLSDRYPTEKANRAHNGTCPLSGYHADTLITIKAEAIPQG